MDWLKNIFLISSDVPTTEELEVLTRISHEHWSRLVNPCRQHCSLGLPAGVVFLGCE